MNLETSLLYMGIGVANLVLLAWYQHFSERVGIVPIFHAGVALVALGCMTLFQFSASDEIGNGLAVGSTVQLVQFCAGTMVVLSVGSPLWYTPNLLIFGAMMQVRGWRRRRVHPCANGHECAACCRRTHRRRFTTGLS